MKLINLLFAAAALVVGFPAFAQEESASPEEKASVSVEATSESTPAAKSGEGSTSEPTNSIWDDKQDASPSPTPPKRPAALTKAKVTPATKAATPAKTPAPAQSAAPVETATPAAPVKPAKKGSVEASLKEMENKWEASIPTHDATAVDPFIATDYAGVSSKGKFTNKTSLLAELKGDQDTYKSAKNEKLNIHLYGPSVAVVTGTAREKGTGTDGQPFDRNYRFTDTWVERNGQWQCVASHSAIFTGK